MEVVSKDKIIDIDDDHVVEAEVVEEAVEKVAVKEEATRVVPKNVQLSELEYSALSKTLSTIQRLKVALKETPHQETAEQINFLESSIWDDIVKRFGWNSMEAAQGDGYLFTVKTVHVVECYKKDEA
jgi:hypothetical protein